MSIIKIIGLSSLLLITYLFLPAQNNFLVERFTTDNGLPSNGIKGLQWDEKTGFLWIATEDGITRYNGTDFLNYSRANMPELSSERMLFLLKNRDGMIFTSDESGDLFSVAGNRLHFMDRVKIDTRSSTFKLTGLIASAGLFRQSSTEIPGDFGFNFFIETLIPLSDNRVILTHNDSLYDYRTGRREPVLLAALEPGSKAFFLAGHLFVLEAGREFYRVDQETGEKTSVAINGIEGNQHLFWDNSMKYPILVSGPKAWLLDYSGGKLLTRLICTAIPTNALLSYAKYDSTNEILFLGTDSKGIIIIRKNQVRPMKTAKASPENPSAYYSQIALEDGSILTSQGDVIRVADGQPGTASSIFPPIHTPFNNFVFTTPDSVLWYSHFDTVYSYSARTKRTVAIPAGPLSITEGFAISQGNLYTADAVGVGQIRGTRIEYGYRYPVADISSNVPFAMLEMSPGLLAIATCNGLFRYNTLDHRLDTLLRLPGICVRALWKYKGFLFIGTYGQGIFLYKDGKIGPIPLDKNGWLQYAHCFIPDKLGLCWISTNKGLFRAQPDDMIRAFGKRTGNIYYRYYGRRDGMEMTELNGGCTPCAISLNDTVLSFPSMDGLVWVDPTGPLFHLPEGRVFIDEFTADSLKIDPDSRSGADLPSNTRELTFSLGFPAWADKENLKIQYLLEPYSEDWQTLEVESHPKLHFSNLPSGKYRLTVRKSNSFSTESLSTTEIGFIIEPHWYQQWWSWLLCLCLISVLLTGVVRWRTRQFEIRQGKLEIQIAEKTKELQAKNQELEKSDTIKTRLISIISHDLITPLRFLHLTGKNLMEKNNGLTEDLQQEAIAEITSTSKELELLSTNILNWIKYRNEERRLEKESFNLNELVSRLFGIFHVMTRHKKVRLINDVDNTLTIHQYIEPVRIVLYNLILNSINFTSEGYIRVSSQIVQYGVTFFIEDTGVGMTQDQITNIMGDHFIISSANVDNRKGNGLGYLIVKDLMKILHGDLSIQSEKDKGTCVTVWIPLQ